MPLLPTPRKPRLPPERCAVRLSTVAQLLSDPLQRWDHDGYARRELTQISTGRSTRQSIELLGSRPMWHYMQHVHELIYNMFTVC